MARGRLICTVVEGQQRERRRQVGVVLEPLAIGVRPRAVVVLPRDQLGGEVLAPVVLALPSASTTSSSFDAASAEANEW